MNFVHLHKLCAKTVAKTNISNEHIIIRPFIKTPSTICNNRSFATKKSKLNPYEIFPNMKPSFGSSQNRVPPDLADQLENEAVFQKLDAILQEMEGQTGGLRIPYTVDLRDKIHVNQVLDMGRHCRVTASGRIFSYSALVVIGTGDGTAGIGYGKSDKPMDAVAKAQTDAQKRMISISRWHSALPHTIISRYRGTKVVMMAGRPGTGVSGHPALQIVADAFGLQDITCKTFRSRNTRKIVAAMVYGILKNANLHPASKAKMTGRKFVSLENYWKPPPPVPKTTVRKSWSTTAEPTDQERHENLATLATAPGIDIYNFARDYGIDLDYRDVMFGKMQKVNTVADESEVPEQKGEEEEEDLESTAEAQAEFDAIDPDFTTIHERPLNAKSLEERIYRETRDAPLSSEKKQ